MAVSPNPIANDGQQRVRFSNHVRFRMDEPDVDRRAIETVLASPYADFEVDPKSGNYVFRTKDYRIVVRKSADSFLVTSLFKTDQSPFS